MGQSPSITPTRSTAGHDTTHHLLKNNCSDSNTHGLQHQVRGSLQITTAGRFNLTLERREPHPLLFSFKSKLSER